MGLAARVVWCGIEMADGGRRGRTNVESKGRQDSRQSLGGLNLSSAFRTTLFVARACGKTPVNPVSRLPSPASRLPSLSTSIIVVLLLLCCSLLCCIPTTKSPLATRSSLIIINHQPSTINQQPATINHQLAPFPFSLPSLQHDMRHPFYKYNPQTTHHHHHERHRGCHQQAGRAAAPS